MGMNFAKLLTANGEQIQLPKACPASLAWDAKDGKAFAWGPDGATLLAELVCARIAWVGSTGIRVEGMEPVGLGGARLRAQIWHFSW